MTKNVIPKCRPTRDFVQVIKDNADGTRTQQLSECLQPVVTVEKPKKVQP